MKTTIVIPNYNGIKYLKNCIESLKLAKEQGEFSIVVVDNGSTDGSLQQAKGYEAQGILEVVAFPENTGFCGAVNEGIRYAKTEYVLLLNNDTEVEPNFVKELEAFMDCHPLAFSASSKMLSLQEPDVIDDCGDLYCALGWAFGLGKGQNIKTRPAKKYEKDGIIFASCGGASIYRKKVFDEIGMFDEHHFAYLEDIDIGYRALLSGYRNYYCHSAVVYHAGSGFSGSRYNKFKIDLSAKNSIYLIYKNMPFLQVFLNLPFLLLGFMVKTMFFTKKGFGGTYLNGLMKGVKLSCSKETKVCRVKFQPKNLPNYIRVQGYLWWNILRRFLG